MNCTPKYLEYQCEPVHRVMAIGGAAVRERKNWQIFSAFARQDYPECLQIIEEELRECKGLAEYPIYVKGEYICHF